MSEGRLSTEFLVGAQIRTMMREGLAATVIRRGDANSGAIMLKINLLNGTARVLSEVTYNDTRVWTPVSKTDPMPEQDADAYLICQADIDPDCWQIEIEDKQGRHWFPGKVL